LQKESVMDPESAADDITDAIAQIERRRLARERS